MTSEPTASIEMEDLAVSFPLYAHESRSLRNFAVSVSTAGRVMRKAGGPRLITALDGISASIHAGDRVGLVGRNGAGKSTLLRSLAGIYAPSGGRLSIKGTTGCIIELGGGMHDDATGFENIDIVGTLHGLSKAEIATAVPDVAAFSGLGDFLHLPLRTYSSGMRLRLAFAVATIKKPDILLIDEIFGVGDMEFRKQARHRVETVIGNTQILILATHDKDIMRMFCNKVLWLESGRIKAFGPIDGTLDVYESPETVTESREADVGVA